MVDEAEIKANVEESARISAEQLKASRVAKGEIPASEMYKDVAFEQRRRAEIEDRARAQRERQLIEEEKERQKLARQQEKEREEQIKEQKKQAEEIEKKRAFENESRKESRRLRYKINREEIKIEREKREATAKKLRDAEENIKKVRARQQAREEDIKTKEFEEIRRKNEARIAQDKKYQEALKAEKSSAQRIRLRQQEEERIRMENLRISAANKGIKQSENMPKLINFDRISGVTRNYVEKAPAGIDRLVTGIFTPIVQQTTGERKQPDFVGGFKQESKEFSRAVSSTAKKPVTGGKIKPVKNQFAVSADERFASSLLGGIGSPQQLRQPAKVGKQQIQQQPEKMDLTRPLNNLLRRII